MDHEAPSSLLGRLSVTLAGCPGAASRPRLAARTVRTMCAHPPAPDDPAMNQPQPTRYEIHVRGHLGDTLLAAFDGLGTRAHGSETILFGTLPDQAALYGVLAQIEALGLELLEVRRVGP